MSNIAEINLLYHKLKADSEISTESMIKSLIDSYLKSDDRTMKINGINYYDSENTAIKNKKDKDLIVNHKVANGFYKKLVDQKVSYCVGNEIVVENLPDDIEIDINDFIGDLGEGTSMKGIEWIYPYMNAKGLLDYKIIDSSECIPIWDTEFEDTLVTMIRFYQIELVSNDKSYWRNRVEVYDNEKVTYYQEDVDNNYAIDTEINLNPVYYNSNAYVVMGEVTNVENFGWGVVPFIPLLNNKKAVYDLQNVKADIDLYDVIKSDFANNFELNMEAILVLVNRGAQDLEDFKEKLEKYRIIEVDDVEGMDGVRYLTLDIPYEARQVFLDIIRKDIYSNGFGVDTKEVGDGNITNIVIKSRYADLDLKANKFIKQIKKFLNKWYEFVNIYRGFKNKPAIDIESLEYVFNKKMIFNESELVEDFVKQGGKISNRTLLSNHKDVNDVDEEIKQIEEEEAQYKDDFDMNNDVSNIDENNLDGDNDG